MRIMLKDTVMTLCELKGVSGNEDEVRNYIVERIMPHIDELRTDAIGNVMAFKRGAARTNKRVMLCAHMDEVGLIVTSIGSDGYLKFDTVGGIDRRVLLGKRVLVGPGSVPGIIGLKAYHLVSKEEEKNVPKVDAMYIDIGAGSAEEAEGLVNLGDTVCFATEPEEFGEGFLKARAIDDRVGCAVMIELIERRLPCDVWFAFTTQEEVGTRGAHTAAFEIQPDIALVLEGTTAADLAGVEGPKRICSPGNGPVVPFMDRGTVYDRGLFTEIKTLADSAGIQWQTKQMVAGGTDAAAVQRSRSGVRTAAISAAIRNIHSPVCIAKLSDMDGMLSLAELFLKETADKYGI